MLPDSPTAVARVLGQINDLRQSLMGFDVPKVTPDAEVDDQSLAAELRNLQTTIDEFLEGKY